MKKSFLIALMFATGLMLTSPAFAHCGMCGSKDVDHPVGASACPTDCSKPCCADKKKVCATHGVKDRCCKKNQNPNVKKNFGPRVKS